MSFVPLDFAVSGPGGRKLNGQPLYIIERGDPDRIIDPDNPEATETLVTVYADPAGATPVTQPLLSDSEGRFRYYVAEGAYDRFWPNDSVNPVEPWEAASGIGGGGGGGAPSGPAGGVLGGSYPNPSFASDMATQAELDAAIAGGAPPVGSAGGVLSGSYPNPGFAVDMATQAELDAAIAGVGGGGGPPTGAAGGDLGGTYPNPTVDEVGGEAAAQVAAFLGVLAVVGSPEFPAVGDNSADDTAELQAAIDSGRKVWVSEPSAAYKITAALDVPSETHISGVGWSKAIIRQHTEAEPVMVIDGRIHIEDVALEHAARPSVATVPNGVGIRCREVDDTSVIERVYINRCTSGIYCKEVFGADSSAYIFSTSIRDCKIKNFTHSAMFLSSTNAGNTGNVIENVLATNNDDGGSPQSCTSAAFTFANWAQGFAAQLNIEHGSYPRGIDIQDSRSLAIESVNIETVTPNSNQQAFFKVFGSNAGVVTIKTVRLRDVTFDGAIAAEYALLRVENTAKVQVTDVYEHVSTAVNAQTTRRTFASTVTEGASIEYGRLVLPTFSGDLVAATTTPIIRRKGTQLVAISDSTSDVPLTVRGIASQGVDLFRVYDGGGTLISAIDLNGNRRLIGGYDEVAERGSAPGSPTDAVRVWADDDGSGNTRYRFKTPDGTVHELNSRVAQADIDGAIALRDTKQSVRAATTAALPANTRSGNVLTASANGALAAIDGVSLIVGDRLLVKNEAASNLKHGIYTVTSLGDGSNPWVLTRATDADASAEVTSGLTVAVEEGTINAGSGWRITTANPITLNTTALAFTRVDAIVSDFIRTLLDDADAATARATLGLSDAELAVLTANNQTGTSYTLVLGDAGKVIEFNNAGAMTLTVPANSTVAFAVGTVIEVWRQGAGTLTLAPAGGVTIRSPGGLLSARAQYSSLSLRKRATDEWVLSGDLA